MSFVDSMVGRLLNGDEGATIIASIRAHYKTPYSFEKNVSNIRRFYLAKCQRHVQYQTDLEKAFQLSDPDVVHILTRFASLSVPDQYDTLKRKDNFCSNNIPLTAWMKTFHLLPDTMNTYSLTNDDLRLSRLRKTATLLARNRRAIEISTPHVLLQTQLGILQHGTKSLATEILALLFVSGRRETEILNGKSTFERVATSLYHTQFTGVLKKKTNRLEDNVPVILVIPLLCTFEMFDHALLRLRKRQANNLTTLTNKQISKRYCSQLCLANKKHFPMLTKPHDLRGVYVRYVDAMFEHGITLPLVCMLSLGHDSMTDALHYMTVTFNGQVTRSNGMLQLTSHH